MTQPFPVGEGRSGLQKFTLPIHAFKHDSDEGDDGSALVAGSVKGGAGVRLPGFPVLCARSRTTFRRAQPRIASVLRHRRGSTRIHHSTRAVTECPGSDSSSQFVPTRLARIRPGPTDIRHGMIRGWVSGGQGCYRLTRGSTGGPSPLYRA